MSMGRGNHRCGGGGGGGGHCGGLGGARGLGAAGQLVVPWLCFLPLGP